VGGAGPWKAVAIRRVGDTNNGLTHATHVGTHVRRTGVTAGSENNETFTTVVEPTQGAAPQLINHGE